MAEELKPCPFCSCTDIGEVTINPRLEQHHRRFKVYCKACQCRTSEHKTRKEARIYWNTRAKLPNQGGEAVEVVAWSACAGSKRTFDFKCDAVAAINYFKSAFPNGKTDMIELMTVAQHQRILAASVDSGEPTEYQQLSRYGYWDRIDKAVFDLGMLGNCPEKFRALYTHPADQVAEGVVVARELRSVLAMILNALDRDAAEGKQVRREMAEELRALLNGGRS